LLAVVFDLSFFISIGLIFLVALFGAYLRSIVRDRCLKSWDGFHITLEQIDGKLIWGVMHLEPTGMELSYLDTVQDEKHIESTFLLYNSEYKNIQAIYRYADKLSEWGKKQRARDIERSFHPGPLRRLGRKTRNFLSTATDSLNEVMGIVLGRVQKSGSRFLTEKDTAALGKLSGQVIGQTGSMYDPLLERYIGRRVVIELAEGNEVHEHVGIFKNYSADFIEVLEVQYPQHQTLRLTPEGTFESERIMVFGRDGALEVSNHDSWPILVVSLKDGDLEEPINAVVDAGETIVLHPASGSLRSPHLLVRAVQELDMIVPRNRSAVRHRAESAKPEKLADLVMDIVFDVGMVFAADSTRSARETRLREELRRDPMDALAAANLGELLLQKGSLNEAEKWLQQALRNNYSLPDGGRRVRMELREIERRLRGEGDRWAEVLTPPSDSPAVDDAGPHI
jgi:tetratricopeptide (TPR) repeat protein